MIVVAWLVHLYTATGVVLAFLAAIAAIDHDYRTAFFYLALQIAVDVLGFFDRALAQRKRQGVVSRADFLQTVTEGAREFNCRIFLGAKTG